MASLRRDLLTPLQIRVLEHLAREHHPFFLTGGAALGPFYLHHRASRDLDFFTTEEAAFPDSAGWAERLARALGARLETQRVSPYFRRVFLTTPDEGLRVEFVLDVPPQVVPVKPVIEGVRVDSLDDIFCNKIGAVVGRSEVRDLIDLCFLERAGYSARASWRRALDKEGGITAEVLAHQLSLARLDAPWPPLAVPLKPEELAAFRDDLVRSLAREAFPG